MSLWCSLLGHRFEDREVEREREERTEEVLTTTREVERCGRCGTRRVVSETTEVTTVEPAPDHVTDDPDSGALSGEPTAEPVEPRDPAEEDTEILEDGEPDRTPGEWPSEPGAADDPGADASDADAGDGPSDDGTGAPSTGPARSGEGPPERFECPECGYVADAPGSSLRAGDSCPECRTGYLETP